MTRFLRIRRVERTTTDGAEEGPAEINAEEQRLGGSTEGFTLVENVD